MAEQTFKPGGTPTATWVAREVPTAKNPPLRKPSPSSKKRK